MKFTQFSQLPTSVQQHLFDFHIQLEMDKFIQKNIQSQVIRHAYRLDGKHIVEQARVVHCLLCDKYIICPLKEQ